MNILLLTQDFPPLHGGIAHFLNHICYELKKREHNIEVLCSSTHGDKKFDSNQTFSVHRYHCSRRFSSIKPILKVIYHYFRRQLDLIFIGRFTTTHAIGAILLWKAFKLPYVILIHGNDLRYSIGSSEFSSKIDNLVADVILKNASLVFANSSSTEERIIKKGYSKRNIIILNPGVDIKIFNPSVDPSEIIDRYGLSGKKVILTVGRLEKVKGHDKALRAIRSVIKHVPNFVYLTVGNGSEERDLKKIVDELGIKHCVRFVGPIKNRDLPKFYCACDVFIMTSIEVTETGDFESFGIAFSEASACTKPIIGSHYADLSGAVVNGVTGILVNPLDVDEISRAIITLLTDEKLARHLGENGRRRVEEELSWEKVGERLEGYLSSVVTAH